MPGAPRKGHELDDRSVTPDEEMGRHVPVADTGEVRVTATVEAVGEELLYVRSSELSRRQADAVNDDQRRIFVVRTVVLIR
jgi:hypothetical protein